MNVLVYSDEGSSIESVRQTRNCLRTFLSDKYAVSTITAEQITSEPWPAYTSLLVFPGGADLPYCRKLNGAGNEIIRNYVRKGGSFLGICAGGYYACSSIEFEKDTQIEVSGPRELGFYEGVGKGCVYKGFQYCSQAGARSVPVKFASNERTSCFYNGGCLFEGDVKAQNLASYTPPVEIESIEESPSAVVYKPIGSGHVVLSGVHFEYDMDDKIKQTGELSEKLIKSLEETESSRSGLIKLVLSKLNLEVSDVPKKERVPAPTLMNMSCLPSFKPNVDQFMDSISSLNKDGIVKDANNTFKFVDQEQVSLKANNDETMIQVYRNGHPSLVETPFFNHSIYFAELNDQIAHSNLKSSILGNLLLYAEVTPSTNIIFEKNLQFLKQVPHGTICVATQQTAGRGRGNNVWVNPVGVLAVSGVFRIPTSQCTQPLVFTQYLVSLALVNAVHSFLPPNTDIGMRMKWPNDIYMQLEDKVVKIGGVSVSCNAYSNEFVVVFGCGSNIDNDNPTTCVNKRIRELNAGPQILHEALLARFMVTLETYFENFMVNGFKPFEQMYYNTWLHSNANVTLERYNHVKAVIKGISMESGMLIAEDEHHMKYELQPDGNSFDMFSGLISRKVY